MVSIKFYDNGGITRDRYTVIFDVFGNTFVCSMSESPSHPQGVCSLLSTGPVNAAFRRRVGKPLRGEGLVPDAVKAQVIHILKTDLGVAK